ncbi:MAG: hypothetical protein RLZZ241_676 [Bacteroidota bacterium]|jgi:predicted DCC family thiol-disulfide oxidoreductase YuxK
MANTEQKIILFDGTCNLCNNSVNFIIKRDLKNIFSFAPLQGETGKKLCEVRHINTQEVDSIILINPGKAYYIKARAAIEIAKELKGFGWIRLFDWLISDRLANFIYDLVAKNRYKWFGRQSKCMVPTPELQNKFI